MSDFNAFDSALRGRAMDPVIRQGMALVDYPDYLIAEALSGDGLGHVNNSIGAESLTPEAVAEVITARIIERIAEDIAKNAPQDPPPSTREHKASKGRASFIPTLSAKFPRPIVSRIFGKKETPPGEPVFEDDAAPIDFSAPLSAALLLRAEAVTLLWRQGKIEEGRGAHLLEIAVEDFRTHQTKG